MPRKLEDALDDLEGPSKQLANALGPENVRRYVQVKRTEMQKLRDMADTQGEAAVTAWMVQRY
jgi:glutamine synthetase